MSIDIFDIKLDTYPGWVQTLMFGSALIWVVAYALLGFFAPKAATPLLEWVEFIQIKNEPAGGFAFAATFVNNTGKTVALQSATLMYFKDQPPKSGLQQGNAVDTTYTITVDGSGATATNTTGISTDVTVTHNLPYAGQPFVEADLPLSDVIENGKKSRILVRIPDASSIAPQANTLRVEVVFSNGTSLTRDLKISR